MQIMPNSRESTEYRVPMCWESLTEIPDMDTSKILSNYTDVGTELVTHSLMFTEEVLGWAPASVTLLRKTQQSNLDLSRSV